MGQADFIVPLYKPDKVIEDLRAPKQFTFTGYKSPRCRVDLDRHGIPMDGTWTIYRLQDFPGRDGIFSVFFNLLDIEELKLGLGPRAYIQPEWIFVKTTDAMRIRRLCETFGVTDKLSLCTVKLPEGEVVRND